MQVKGLDGKFYNFKLVDNSTENCSEPHSKAREIIKIVFPFVNFYEEVYLPGSDGLRADFFLPLEKLIVEVHGEQHYKMKAHFHGSMAGFLNSLKRDKKKKEWCEINGIKLIILPFDRKDEWQTILTK